MDFSTVLMYIVAISVVVSLGVFFILAWKFGPRSGQQEIHITSDEIHLSVQP
jgi:hypothetical protein